MRASVITPLIRAVLVAVIVSGCRGENAPPQIADQATESQGEQDSDVRSSSPTTDRACELLTRQEAAALLRSSIKKVGDESAPQPIGTMLRSSCFYRSDDGGTVQLTLDKHTDAETSTQKFDRLVRRYRGGSEVPDLGDAAFSHNEVLMVRRADAHLMITLNPGGERKIKSYSDRSEMDALLGDERKVASRALSRLPAAGSPVAVRSPGPGSDRSACAFISREEMEQILGGPLAHAVPADSPGRTSCTYTGASGRYAKVEVEWNGGESGMAAARMAGSIMGRESDRRIKVETPIAGLGDEAVMLVGGVLSVRKGAALISVDLRMQRDAESKSKAIAEKVLAKLPAKGSSGD